MQLIAAKWRAPESNRHGHDSRGILSPFCIPFQQPAIIFAIPKLSKIFVSILSRITLDKKKTSICTGLDSNQELTVYETVYLTNCYTGARKMHLMKNFDARLNFNEK